MKRVLLITQYFYPENFKSNDIAFELVKNGYKVDALVGIPNYPEGKYYKGYGLCKRRYETFKDVNIIRVFQFPRGKKANGIKLALNYFSYAFTASIYGLLLSFFFKYDCIIVHAPSPITQAIPAVLLKKLRKIPFHIWVLDIWPDALKSGGKIQSPFILNNVNRLVESVYNNSSKILISSKGFKDLINKKGNHSDKIVYFPNWSDDIHTMKKLPVPPLPEGYKIIMAGNLGSAQRLDLIFKTILELKGNKELKWIFIGNGSKRDWLIEEIKKHSLDETVFVLGRFHPDYMPSFFNSADALLITLKADFPHLRAVVPARLQTYLASGKPILGMIDGGAADIIKEANCGYCVNADDYKELSKVISTKVLMDKWSFQELGRNGRKYYLSNFTKENCINHLIEIIENKNG